jgi:hypothetical protein
MKAKTRSAFRNSTIFGTCGVCVCVRDGNMHSFLSNCTLRTWSRIVFKSYIKTFYLFLSLMHLFAYNKISQAAVSVFPETISNKFN